MPAIVYRPVRCRLCRERDTHTTPLLPLGGSWCCCSCLPKAYDHTLRGLPLPEPPPPPPPVEADPTRVRGPQVLHPARLARNATPWSADRAAEARLKMGRPKPVRADAFR